MRARFLRRFGLGKRRRRRQEGLGRLRQSQGCCEPQALMAKPSFFFIEP
jgi:hypothetical protein